MADSIPTIPASTPQTFTPVPTPQTFDKWWLKAVNIDASDPSAVTATVQLARSGNDASGNTVLMNGDQAAALGVEAGFSFMFGELMQRALGQPVADDPADPTGVLNDPTVQQAIAQAMGALLQATTVVAQKLGKL